jgi:hypothetical protein
MMYSIEAINTPPRKRTLDIAFAGRMLGGDRCVRSNAPFSQTLRVAVYAVASDEHRTQYRVGVVASGYFEITISEPQQRKSATAAVAANAQPNDSNWPRNRGLPVD